MKNANTTSEDMPSAPFACVNQTESFNFFSLLFGHSIQKQSLQFKKCNM